MVQAVITSPAQRLRTTAPAPVESASAPPAEAPMIEVDPNRAYQRVLGFGAACTDSACYVVWQLPACARDALLAELFSPSAMALSVCRVCAGASDYARECYSYDDTPGDRELRHFSIGRDKAYIIPFLLEAQALSPDMFLFSSPWSPPGWMKTSGSMFGGRMCPAFLETYADYYLRYLQEYAAAGVRISALTPQNEPETDQDGRMPACYWHPEHEASFVRDHLGPRLRRSGLGTGIWLMDHNYDLWRRADRMLCDAGLRGFVDGVAFHGYGGDPAMMSRLHEAHPDVDVYWTEGGPDLGAAYALDWCRWGVAFTEIMRNWSRSITVWNLALDERGLPKIGPFPCAGLVTVDSATKEISRSGQYWALAHFSRFVRRGAVRIESTGTCDTVHHVAFLNPDGTMTLVVTNPGQACRLRLLYAGQSTAFTAPADSISTLVWARQK